MTKSGGKMARTKYDGIIESVHFEEEGTVGWVRAFLRRGPTWSDLTLIYRDELVDQLKSGKHFVSGKRLDYMGTTFETGDSINLIDKNNHVVLVTDDIQSDNDRLEGIPIL
jgi:hypothetical protein